MYQEKDTLKTAALCFVFGDFVGSYIIPHVPGLTWELAVPRAPKVLLGSFRPPEPGAAEPRLRSLLPVCLGGGNFAIDVRLSM
jgi:hypothetical protein